MIRDKCKGLLAPDSFWETDEQTLSMMVGGCGPGKYGDYLVPDSMYGLSIKAACIVHDYEYAIGKVMNDKRRADLHFLENLLFIVNKKSKWKIAKWFRGYRVMSYYLAVANGGDSSFKKAALG